MIESPARRRAVLAALVLVAVACVALVTVVVVTRSAGDGLGERLQSLKDDEVPTSEEAADREELIATASDFATGFYTYGSDMLDQDGHLPDYAALSELMTPKFGEVFTNFVGLAEQTVADVDASSVGKVYAVGVASQDDDSAQVLVAGTVALSATYEPSDQGGKKGGNQSDDPIRVDGDPHTFRFEVSLVKIDGTWLVDEVDDIDDGLPPLSQPAVPEDGSTPGQTPSTTPPPTSPSDGESTEPSGEGEQ